MRKRWTHVKLKKKKPEKTFLTLILAGYGGASRSSQVFGGRGRWILPYSANLVSHCPSLYSFCRDSTLGWTGFPLWAVCALSLVILDSLSFPCHLWVWLVELNLTGDLWPSGTRMFVSFSSLGSFTLLYLWMNFLPPALSHSFTFSSPWTQQTDHTPFSRAFLSVFNHFLFLLLPLACFQSVSRLLFIPSAPPCYLHLL